MADNSQEYVSHDFSAVDRQINEVARREAAITASMRAKNLRSYAITGVIVAGAVSIIILTLFLAYYLFSEKDHTIATLGTRLEKNLKRIDKLEQELKQKNKVAHTSSGSSAHRIDLVIKNETSGTSGSRPPVSSQTPSGPALERLKQKGRDFRSGHVHVALSWDTYHDLDLLVISPRGEKIYHGSKKAASGGKLDIDANLYGRPKTRTPVENIKWVRSPPAGEYKISVKLHRRADEDKLKKTEYTVEWRNQKNGGYYTERGSFDAYSPLRSWRPIATFTVP